MRMAAASALLPLISGCRGSASAQRGADLLGRLRQNGVQDANCEWCGARDTPDGVSSRAILAATDEEGERIAIAGTVFAADGMTPAPNTLIYLYHTDANGIYGSGGEHRHGRYRSWLLTDSRGKYQFETIRPASYPDSTIAAHIHMTITTEKQREDWIDSILFAGDRFITAREREGRKGGFDPVVKLEMNDKGVLSGVRNIKLA
ncbi:hypothetical protein BH24ACI3_BH24ACI3_00920 [soil metagenome]